VKRAELEEIDALELRDALAAGSTLVDVREPAEFAGGRITGAKLIPLGRIGERADEIDREGTVYLICRTGRRSGEARRKLAMLGFGNLVNVRGGMTAWHEAGLPVERDERAPWSLERQVRFVAGLIVVLGLTLALLVAWPFAVISALVGAGLIVSAATDTCAMGLLLAKAPWNKVSSGGDVCSKPRSASER